LNRSKIPRETFGGTNPPIKLGNSGGGVVYEVSQAGPTVEMVGIADSLNAEYICLSPHVFNCIYDNWQSFSKEHKEPFAGYLGSQTMESAGTGLETWEVIALAGLIRAVMVRHPDMDVSEFLKARFIATSSPDDPLLELHLKEQDSISKINQISDLTDEEGYAYEEERREEVIGKSLPEIRQDREKIWNYIGREYALEEAVDEAVSNVTTVHGAKQLEKEADEFGFKLYQDPES
jgi:hypothetical protein